MKVNQVEPGGEIEVILLAIRLKIVIALQVLVEVKHEL